jgi:predicted DNA-binding transcriptional regulator AlpA
MIELAQLGGTAEIAQLLGCPPQQIYSLRKRKDFPQPVWRVRATPLWDLRTVKEFKEQWVRRVPSVTDGDWMLT